MTTMAQFGCWSNPVDAAQVSVYTTLTRYTDPVNNSDKYRRFISIWAPGVPGAYMFTHTGRWTGQASAGRWNGGTYRVGSFISAAFWNRNGRSHMDVHQAWVNAKKGDYQIQGVHASSGVTDQWTRYALAHLEFGGGPLLRSLTQNGVTGVTPAPRPGSETAAPANPVPQRITSGKIGERLSSLLARAHHDGVDPFDLFEDIATLRRDLAAQRTELEKWEQDLALANEQVMGRV